MRFKLHFWGSLSTLVKFFNATFLGLFFLGISGCSLINDPPKTPPQIDQEQLSLSCLEDIPNQMERLFSGKYSTSLADQTDLATCWACLNRSLDLMTKLARGQDPDAYSANELRNFANRFLPSKKTLTADFVDALLRLKAVILGGNSSRLTLSEINLLRLKINQFGQAIAPFSPYIKVVLEPSKSPPPDQETGSKKLIRFLGDFSDILSDSSQDLTWVDLRKFFVELENFSRDETQAQETPSIITMIREQLELFQNIKLMIFGGDEQKIEKNQWRPILNGLSKVVGPLITSDRTSSLLRDLSFEITSQIQDRIKASKNISDILRNLRKDKSIRFGSQVTALADNWAKLVVLSALTQPKWMNTVEVKPFFDSQNLRLSAGFLIETLSLPRHELLKPENIQKLGDYAVSIFRGLGASTTPEPLLWEKIELLLDQHQDLFKDPKFAEGLKIGIRIFKRIKPILIGGEEKSITPDDLDEIKRKGIDFYKVFHQGLPQDFTSWAEPTLETLVRAPTFFRIEAQNIIEIGDNVQKFIRIFEIPVDFSWERLTPWIKDGFKLKNLVFNSGESALLQTDLLRALSLIRPLQQKDPQEPWGPRLERLGKELGRAGVKTLPLDELYAQTQTYLPESVKSIIKTYGLNTLGQMKTLFLGGKTNEITPIELEFALRWAGGAWSRWFPQDKKLVLGLNSATLQLLGDGLSQYIQLLRIYPQSTGSVKNLIEAIESILAANGVKYEKNSIPSLMNGVVTRGFKRIKTTGISLPDGRINATDLKLLLDQAILPLIPEFIEIERLFPLGLNTKRLRSDLGKNVQTPILKFLIQTYEPELDGSTELVVFPDRGLRLTETYAWDLAFKTAIYGVLKWGIPGYSIEGTNPEVVTIRDVKTLLDDIGGFLYDTGLVTSNTDNMESAKSRTLTANLFTQGATGDDTINLSEALGFFSMIYGGRTLLSEAQKKLTETCKNSGTPDRPIFQARCVGTTLYKGPFVEEWIAKGNPQWARELRAMTAQEWEENFKNVLIAADSKLTTESLLDLSMIETFVTLPTYLETAFGRLDQNRDGILQFSEAYSGFPLFCNEISKAAVRTSSIFSRFRCQGFENSGLLDDVYGYLIFHKDVPPSNIFRFGWWITQWSRMNKSPEARDSFPPQLKRSDLLIILSKLNPPPPGISP